MNATVATEQFLHALRAGNYTKAILAINKGADVNTLGEEGITPLMMLANAALGPGTDMHTKTTYRNLIQKLIERGADVNARDVHQRTALFHACLKNNNIMVGELLLSKRERGVLLEVNATDIHGYTPLMISVLKNNPQIVHMLLRDADIDPNLTTRNVTALYLAIDKNKMDVVSTLLASSRIDPNRGNTETGLTPLHIAVVNNNRELVSLLLRDPRVDPNRVDAFDARPIDLARMDERHAIVELLAPFVRPPPSLSTEMRTHQYTDVPQVYDFIMLNDVNISDLDPATTIVFKLGEKFFALPKEQIQKEIAEDERTRYECTRELVGAAAPTLEDIERDTKYYFVSGGPFPVVVPQEQMEAALVHPEFHTFELAGPLRRLAHTSDYKSVQVMRGLGFKGREIDITSGKHCQDGSTEELYTIHPLRLVPAAAAAGSAGGARRRRRTRRHAARRRHPSRTWKK